MNVFLLDLAETRLQLLPLTYTRSIGDIRVGILKIHEKWSLRLTKKVSILTEGYLGESPAKSDSDSFIVINSSLCPDENTIEQINQLQCGQLLQDKGKFLALNSNIVPEYGDKELQHNEVVEFEGSPVLIERPWHIFQQNGEQIRQDFDLLTEGRQSQSIDDPHTKIYNEEAIFLESGAQVKACILNAENGPIYIGKNAVIEEGAIIRGPFALCDNAKVNLGAKIKGDSTFGPYCKVGGEVGNSVLFGYSNKGHEGYLGNSVIGEWCNIGADTNTSNLKNNYAQIKLWDYSKDRFSNTGLQFCGLIMGDYSKSGINTMFNTGTVVGLSANIFGSGFPRTIIPSFGWGGATGFGTYDLTRAKEAAKIAKSRKHSEWSDADDRIFDEVFRLSQKYRIWENEKDA
ncbi:MAG: glucose-1-phosphate thymidylyltransferase [Cyclobacteriaceae bacterium]